MLAGGLCFALSVGLTSVSIGFGTLVVALVIGNPATGAFVSLAQATLMDLEPEQRERNMALPPARRCGRRRGDVPYPG